MPGHHLYTECHCAACGSHFYTESEVDEHLPTCKRMQELIHRQTPPPSLVVVMDADEYEALERDQWGRGCMYGVNAGYFQRVPRKEIKNERSRRNRSDDYMV